MEISPCSRQETPQPTSYRTPKTNRPLEEALDLIIQCIIIKQENLKLYDYLISAGSLEEHIRIILKIREAELKHINLLKETFKHHSGIDISIAADRTGTAPDSYTNALRQCFNRKLDAVELHRVIMGGLPDIYYRVMIFEMLIEELRHAEACNNILLQVMDYSSESNTSGT